METIQKEINQLPNFKSNIKNYLIIGLTITVMVLLSMKGCTSNDKINPESSKVIKQDTTLNIIEKIDTVNIPGKNVIVYKSIYYPKTDTIYKTIGIDSNISKSTRVYNDSVKKGTNIIFYKAVTIGELKSLDLSSKNDIMKIEDSKTIIKTITNTVEVVKPSKFSFYSGLNLMGSKTSFDLGPFINLNFKKNSIGLAYNVINQQVMLLVGYKLWNSKK